MLPQESAPGTTRHPAPAQHRPRHTTARRHDGTTPHFASVGPSLGRKSPHSCSHAASRAGGQPLSFIGYYRCGCLRRRGFTWSSGDAGICHAPALNERRRRRRRRRRREPAHRRTAPADSGEAAAAIPSDTTGASHRGANSPPRRCLRSHVFDGLLASKRGTARLGTRTIQQHCINVPSKWTLSLFGWAQRPSHTPPRPSIFAS